MWINNSWVAAQCIAFAILLGIPIPYVLFQNAANLGVIGGLMFHAGKGDVFLGLLTPHGLLELTAVFLAGGGGHATGLVGDLAGEPAARTGARRTGPGGGLRRRRTGRRAAGLGPDRGARHAVAVADVRAHRDRRRSPRSAFLAYVIHFGRKAVAAGETGDVDDAPDVVPTR